MGTSNQWFDVDRAGLRALVAGRPKAFMVRELVQNAWDEAGVSEVQIMLEPVAGKAKAELTVYDDAPEGFYDLRHAFTLFAHTRKRGDPTKRGRFNVGEKQVLALCDEAEIVTTKGSVRFTRDGRRIQSKKSCTEAGSIFKAIIPITREELAEVEQTVRTFLPPDGIRTIFNGEELAHRTGKTFEVKLPTERADAEGTMRSTIRLTGVTVIEPEDGETPMLYEMGLPVCETNDRWHYDVDQRVPLTIDRDNVKPAYLRDLRAEVLNHMYDELSEEDAAEPWVQDGLADDRIDSDAVQSIVTKQYGDKAYVPVPNDPKANERAMAMGYQPVSGRAYGKEAWNQIRDAAALPSSIDVAGKTATVDCEHIPADEWTEDMWRVARLAQFIADVGLNIPVTVRMIRSPEASTLADYAGRSIRFNVALLGKRWFRPNNLEAQIDLIIHEIGHEGGGHLEMGYHEALTKIAARLALTAPEDLRGV